MDIRTSREIELEARMKELLAQNLSNAEVATQLSKEFKSKTMPGVVACFKSFRVCA